MSKKKRYEYHDNYERDAYEDRHTKKRAMRSDHKDRWRYNQSDDSELNEGREQARKYR